MPWKIEKASEDHLAAISEIAALWSMDEEARERSKDGFLVSNFKKDDYAISLVSADHFYVALSPETGEVAGFLLAYTSSRIPEDAWADNLAKMLHDSEFVVIKQICIRPNRTKQSLGRQLYEYLANATSEMPLMAATVSDPTNVASEAFHAKLGFYKEYVFTPPDNIMRCWWRRDPSACHSNATSLRISIVDESSCMTLTSQYSAAIRLYSHEDSLNWTKAAAMLTAFSLLAASIGFFVKRPIGEWSLELHLYFYGIWVTGLVVLLAFVKTLNLGVKYMTRRKNAAANIETQLQRFGATAIVGDTDPEMKRSPTTRVLTLAPITLTLVWIFVMIVHLVLISTRSW